MREIYNIQKLIELYFVDYLNKQLRASNHTIASYRDTFRLLFSYAKIYLRKMPLDLTIEDLNAQFILKFLNYLEEERRSSIQSRNQRLAAIHSFFKYSSLFIPECSSILQQVMAIPNKRFERTLIDFLSEEEINALLKAPDRNTKIGRRDHLLLLIGIETGLRVSELINIRCQDMS